MYMSIFPLKNLTRKKLSTGSQHGRDTGVVVTLPEDPQAPIFAGSSAGTMVPESYTRLFQSFFEYLWLIFADI